MTRGALLSFLRSHRYAVETSVSLSGFPQGAVVGIAVSDDFEIVFDTLEATRKAGNLVRRPHVGFVIGGWIEGDARTVQYEGVAALPRGAELDRVRDLYFLTFPDGRERLAWPGIMHFRVTPTWLRYSDYNQDPPVILELDAVQLQALA